MATNAFDIRSGMDVFSSDGQKLGTVGDVFSGEARNMDTARTQFSDTGGGQPAAPAGSDAVETGDSRSDTMNTVGSTQVERIPVSSGPANMNTGTQTTGQAQGAPGALGVAPTADEFGAGGDTTTLTPSDTKYFELKHGGFLGFGGDKLYVPFSAVASVAPGDNVTLAHTAQECGDLYSEKPAPFEGEPAAT